jgi:hypothetical protein
MYYPKSQIIENLYTNGGEYGYFTNPFQEYKGYTIRLRASKNGGFGYAIIKQIESKNLYLRKQIFAESLLL